MEKRKPLTDDDGEVRELSREDFAQMVPFSSLPEHLQKLLASAKQTASKQQASPSKESAA